MKNKLNMPKKFKNHSKTINISLPPLALHLNIRNVANCKLKSGFADLHDIVSHDSCLK